MTPKSSGFPELAPDPEQLEFFSQISSVFLLKALEKPVFYSPMLADVEITREIIGKVNFDRNNALEVNLDY